MRERMEHAGARRTVMPSTMKAVTMREFGDTDVLRMEQLPIPSPATGEVLIEVHSVSVNQTLDVTVRQGGYRTNLQFPVILGTDPAGIVVATGEGVPQSRCGERVSVVASIRCGDCRFCRMGREDSCPWSKHLGLDRWGGYAEYVTMPVENVFPIPDNLSFAEASVITRHFPTAINLLLNHAKLEKGEWVLIMGAAGALGSCGVQIARHRGARVIAAAGADARADAAKDYGAQFTVNYRRQDLEQEVLRITDGHGVDVLFENIADPTLWPGAFNSLAFAGRLVTAGAHGGGTVPLDVKRLYLRRIRIIGQPGATRKDVELALSLAGEGAVRAIIDRTMPLEDVKEAHELLERGGIIGKIVLDPTIG